MSLRRVLRFPGLVVIGLIRLYQFTIARSLAPRCRFHPTCSQYAVDAITDRGLLRGGLAAAWRIARCGPWTKGGIDPVRPMTESSAHV